MNNLRLKKVDNPSLEVTLGLIEQSWDLGERSRAIYQIRDLISRVSSEPNNTGSPKVQEEAGNDFLAKCYCKLSNWLAATRPDQEAAAGTQANTTEEILRYYLMATSLDRSSFRAWQGWALTNLELAMARDRGSRITQLRHNPYILPAIQGLFRCIAIEPSRSFEDILRILTLWFRFSNLPEVPAAVGDGASSIPVECWVPVIPQLIARIHIPNPQTKRLLHQILVDIAKSFPHAIVYPLVVASKSPSVARRTAAISILEKVKSCSPQVVEQTMSVSRELIRIAISWEERWNDGLEEASRLYFGDRNIPAMLALLDGLYIEVSKVILLEKSEL